MGQRHRHRTDVVRQVGDRQAEGEELAIDDPVAQTRPDAEADALGQLHHPLFQTATVARFGHGQTVGDHDPVDRYLTPLGDGAVLARLPDALRIDGGLLQLQSHRIDLAQQVEVDEAVVHRGDDLVGAAVRGARQGRVAAGGVDQDDVRDGLRLGIGGLELRQLLDLVSLGQGLAVAHVRHEGQRQVVTVGRRPGGAVREEALHRPLAQVQINNCNLAARVQQAGDDVDGQGGLAGPALFIADDDDLRLRHVGPRCFDGRDSSRRGPSQTP